MVGGAADQSAVNCQQGALLPCKSESHSSMCRRAIFSVCTGDAIDHAGEHAHNRLKQQFARAAQSPSASACDLQYLTG